MRIRTFVAGVLGAALMTTTALAGEVTLYTWRIQEQPLWDYINQNKVLGDTTVKVVIPTQGDDYEAKMRIALQSSGVDLFQGKAGAAYLSQFIDAGVIKPISTDLGKMNQATVDAARGPDGKVYGVPYAVEMQSVVYNTKVFDDNGIAVPKSMDELNAAADKLKAAGIVPIDFGARAGWWLNQVVGETMTAGLVPDDFAAKLVSGDACFTDPQFVATLQTVKDWQDKGYINDTATADDYDAMRTAVAMGDAAMMIDGMWSTGPSSPMYQVNPDLKMGFFPVPGANGKVYAFGDGSYLLNANSPNAAEAQKVLDFTATADFAKLFTQYVGELSAFGGDYPIDDPRLQTVAKLIATNSAVPTPFFSYALNKGKPGYGDLVAEGYQAMLGGQLSPADVAKKIQDGLNSWNYVGAAKCKS